MEIGFKKLLTKWMSLDTRSPRPSLRLNSDNAKFALSLALSRANEQLYVQPEPDREKGARKSDPPYYAMHAPVPINPNFVRPAMPPQWIFCIREAKQDPVTLTYILPLMSSRPKRRVERTYRGSTQIHSLSLSEHVRHSVKYVLSHRRSICITQPA